MAVAPLEPTMADSILRRLRYDLDGGQAGVADATGRPDSPPGRQRRP
jgi:hypothetical protein